MFNSGPRPQQLTRRWPKGSYSDATHLIRVPRYLRSETGERNRLPRDQRNELELPSDSDSTFATGCLSPVDGARDDGENFPAMIPDSLEIAASLAENRRGISRSIGKNNSKPENPGLTSPQLGESAKLRSLGVTGVVPET